MRAITSLNGDWKYEALAWIMIGEGGREYTMERPLPEPGTMGIPGNWHQGGLPDFYGRVRFARSFAWQENSQNEAYLCFKGVDYRCEVYLNGHYVGKHEGCFQSFEFPVAGKLVNGDNKLEVLVDSPNEEPGAVWPHKKWLVKGILNHWDARPGGWDPERGQDGNTGGIWGDVYLEERHALHIVNAKVHTQILPRHTPDEVHVFNWEDKGLLDSERKAYVWTTVALSSQRFNEIPVEIEVTLTDEAGESHSCICEHVVGHECSGLIVIREPKLWWTWDLGNPHLYNVAVVVRQNGLATDAVSFQTGLREVEVDTEKGIWTVNGKRLFIRGTNVIPTLWLGEYSSEQIDRDIALLKEAHVNGVRVCVHAQREEWYQACDKAGLIVWQDFLLQWGYANDTRVLDSATKQIKDMVRQYYNHPSIALWCCQNESMYYNNEVVGPQLARAAREEDSSRHVHQTSDFREHTYQGWYRGHWRHYDLLPGGRMITEFGAQALPSLEETLELNGSELWPPDWTRLGYHNFQFHQTFYVAEIDHGNNWDTFVRNSQQYQAKLLKTALEAFRVSRFKKVGSLFQFMFMDAWPAITWSVVSHSRVPKLGYYALQQAYQPVLSGASFHDNWPDKTQYGGVGFFVAFDPWVINDLHRRFADCRLTVLIRGVSLPHSQVLSEQVFDLPEDTMLTLDVVRFKILDEFEPGTYEIVFHVEHDGDSLSSNTYPLEIGRKVI